MNATIQGALKVGKVSTTGGDVESSVTSTGDAVSAI